MSDEFSAAQMAQLSEIMRRSIREELADSGLRLDGPDHVDENRKDFQFVRALRVGVNGTAAKIGWLIIAAILGGIVWLVTHGLDWWKAAS